MTAPRPLRVHLVHQGFGDYVEGLVAGLDAVEPGRVSLRQTTITSGAARLTPARGSRPDHERLAVPRFRDPRSPRRARAVVRRVLDGQAEDQPDVVHWQAAGNPWVDLAFLRWIDARSADDPAVVLTVHDMQAHPGDRTVLPGTFALIRRLVRRAERVIVHAPHVADQAVLAGADPERVSVLPHGELGTRYRSAEALPLDPPADPVVLFFGRAQGYKGLDVAIEAMPSVVVAVPDARLVIAGSGPSIDEAFPGGRDVPPWCELRDGLVADDEVPELFERASVVVLPYREASQSGVAALAAGFGRGVVASRLPGLVDIVDEGRTGLLVEPGSAPALADALIEVLADPGLAGRLATGAHRLATTTLAWPLIANDLVGLYDEAVTSRNRSAEIGQNRVPGRERRSS